MKIIIFFQIIFLMLICGCLNRDPLPPYHTTGFVKKGEKTGTIETEKRKIEQAVAKIKAKYDTGSADYESAQNLYTSMRKSHSDWLIELQNACKSTDIKGTAYQNAILAYDKQYQMLFAFLGENLKKSEIKEMEISDDSYVFEVHAKRLFNVYRNSDSKRKKQILEGINKYNLLSFDKL